MDFMFEYELVINTDFSKYWNDVLLYVLYRSTKGLIVLKNISDFCIQPKE